MKIYTETNKCLILTSAKFHVICCSETVFLERVLLLYGHTSYLLKIVKSNKLKHETSSTVTLRIERLCQYFADREFESRTRYIYNLECFFFSLFNLVYRIIFSFYKSYFFSKHN